MRHGLGGTGAGQILQFSNRHLHVAWNIHQHGAGAIARGNGKSLGNHAQQFFNGAHNKVVLGGRNGHAVDVHFLKGIGTDHAQGHLPRNADQRHGIHARIGERRERIGGAGAGSGKDNAGAARDPRHALRYEASALFVTGKNMPNGSTTPEGIVERKIKTARDARNVRDTLVFQQADGEFCSRKT